MVDSGSSEITVQTKLLHEFIDTTIYPVQDNVTGIENEFRSYLEQNTLQAHSDLLSLGLDSHNLLPLTKGEQVILNDENKSIMTDHLLRMFTVNDLVRNLESNTDYDSIESAVEIKNIIGSMNDNVDIVVKGPMITVHVKQQEIMDLLFYSSNSINKGVSSNFPLDIVVNQDGSLSWEQSSQLFLNIIGSEIISGENQNILAHERWHTIDSFRQKIYTEKNTKRIDSLYEENPDRFIHRLIEYLYDPKDVHSHLSTINHRMPEIFNNYINIEVNEQILEGN